MFELCFEEISQFSSVSKQPKIPDYYKNLKYSLFLGSYIVGRIPKGNVTTNAHILLQDSSVSKEHAIINIQKLQNGQIQVILTDKSKYGIAVLKPGAESIVELKTGKQREIQLNSGDFILFGTNYSTFKLIENKKTILVPSFLNSENTKNICNQQIGWNCLPLISAASQQLENPLIILEGEGKNIDLSVEFFWGLCWGFPIIKFEYLKQIVERKSVRDPMPDMDNFQIREIITTKGQTIQVGANILSHLPKFDQDEIFYANMDQLPQEESFALKKLSELCGFNLSSQKIPQAIELNFKNSKISSSDSLNIEDFLVDLLIGKKPQRKNIINNQLNQVQNSFKNVVNVNDEDENTSDENDDDQPSALDMFLSHSKALIQSAKNSQQSLQQKTQDSGMKSTVNLEQEQDENQMDVDTENNQQTEKKQQTEKNQQTTIQNMNFQNKSNNSRNDDDDNYNGGGDDEENVVFKNLIVTTDYQQQSIVQPQNQSGVKNYKKFVKVWPTYMQRCVAQKEAVPSNSTGQQVQRSFQYTTYEMDVADDIESRKEEEELDRKKQIAEKMFNTPVNFTSTRTTQKRKR